MPTRRHDRGLPQGGPLFHARDGRARAVAGVLALLLSALPGAASADRPFLATTSAAAEEDDDNVWSVHTWALGDRLSRQQGAVAEYAFEPRISIEFSLQRARTRGAFAETTLQAETELKWLCNNIARDGWGIGLSLGLGAGKEGDAAWRGGNWQVVAPLSWQYDQGGGQLHLNLGLARERGQPRENLRAVAVQQPLGARLTAFAEWARSGEATLQHGGLRWWLQRERLALDFAAFRRKSDGANGGTGWLIGLNLYDL